MLPVVLLISFLTTFLPRSAPATLASLQFLLHTQHTLAAGPLHLWFLQSGMFSLQVSTCFVFCFFQVSAQKSSERLSLPTYEPSPSPRPPSVTYLPCFSFFITHIITSLTTQSYSTAPQNTSIIFSSLLFSQHLEQHLAHSLCSINICGMGEPG